TEMGLDQLITKVGVALLCEDGELLPQLRAFFGTESHVSEAGARRPPPCSWAGARRPSPFSWAGARRPSPFSWAGAEGRFVREKCPPSGPFHNSCSSTSAVRIWLDSSPSSGEPASGCAPILPFMTRPASPSRYSRWRSSFVFP